LNKGDDGLGGLPHVPAPTNYGSYYHRWTGAHAPQLNPNKIPLTDSGGKDLLEGFYKWIEKPDELSDAHVESSSALSGPNPASSAANPYPLMVEPSGPSSMAPELSYPLSHSS
jgi:hypothetical protein